MCVYNKNVQMVLLLAKVIGFNFVNVHKIRKKDMILMVLILYDLLSTIR